MGVKGLFPYLRRNAPACFSTPPIAALKGRRVAIDGSLLLFREFTSPWLSVSQPHKTALWCIRLLRLCRQYEILPIVIFDSPRTTPAKARERVKRSLVREAAKARLQSTRQLYGRLEQLEATLERLSHMTIDEQSRVKTTFNTLKTSMNKATQRGRQEEETIEDLRSSVSFTPELPITDPSMSMIDQSALSPSLRPNVSDLDRVDEVNELARRLLEHGALVPDPVDDAASSGEQNLLCELMDPNLSEIPIQSLHELQTSTATLIDKLQRRVTFPSYADFEMACKYLKLFGIPAQSSPDHFEGECTASYVVKQGYADYVATEDSDVLVYGVPQLRGFLSISQNQDDSMPYLGEMKLVDPEIMRHELAKFHGCDTSMTESSFVDFALLCGTDFTTPISGYGATKSAKLICSEGTIERGFPLIRQETLKTGSRRGLCKYTIDPHLYDNVLVAREIFATYPVANEALVDTLQSHEALDKVESQFRKLCCNHLEWNSLEQEIIHSESMAQEDIEILDQPSLYQQHNRSRASSKGFARGTTLNDNPNVGYAQGSGNARLIFTS